MHPSLQAAVEHHQAGRLSAAEAIYRQILGAEPNNADALHLLGILAHDLGRHEDAVELIERAHRHMRPQPFSLNNLGVAYLALHRPQEAKRCFAKALALKPDYAEAHSNLGDALDALGQPKDAERSLRRSIALNPDRAIAHYSLGNVLRRRGRSQQAERSYRDALVHQPQFAEAHHNLGIVLFEIGRLDEAAEHCREAIRINPRHRSAHVRLGKTLERLGRLEEAEQSYRAALALDPEAADTLIDLGNLLRNLERHDAAEASYRRALSLGPARAAVINYNLGSMLSSIGRHEDAVRAYREAIAVDPQFAAARWALAMAHPPLIVETCDEVARSRAAFAAELETLTGWFAANPSGDARALVAHPFRLAYQEEDNRELLARYGALSAGVMRKWHASQPSPAGRAKTSAIRVGVVSAHVYDQSVWSAIVKGWLQRLDRDRFELELFYLGHKRDDETAFAAARASHFEQGTRTLSGWVEAIARRRPDVLIYPEIGMDAATANLASLRLARVQVASWGHPETTGLPTLDYYLSAELLEPPNAQVHYTERLVTLPNLGCCFAKPTVAPVAPDFAALGIDERSPILVCAGTPFKYSPCHDWVLPAIAKALERCQLIFFTYRMQHLSEKLHGRLRVAFERSGLDIDRHARFVPWQSAPAFYGLMQRADVMLDTIGFSGFNTAMQAIECALPVVTREGRFLRGRLASGILKRIGLEELIAASEDDYVALAVRLAREDEYRAQIRARIEASRQVLYDDRAPIEALEAFLSSVAGR
jgi:predicted O-linked N-acetylglucosamine transferase (SPINDLY family)